MMFNCMVGPFILMYHSVAANSDDPYSVSVDAFREQISWLSESGFDVVPLSFLLRSIQTQNYKILRKMVGITFDDGYKDFVDNALQILLDRGVPATVFLVTDMLGKRASWNESGTDERLMSEDEVRSIKAHGISLGSHTATHAILTRLGHDELQRQLSDSRDRLTHLGESFYAFSYPWGKWSNQVAAVVKASGYDCALAVGERTRLEAANAYCLPRIIMKRDMNLNRFQSLLTRTRAEMELRRGYQIVLRSIRKESPDTNQVRGRRE